MATDQGRGKSEMTDPAKDNLGSCDKVLGTCAKTVHTILADADNGQPALG